MVIMLAKQLYVDNFTVSLYNVFVDTKIVSFGEFYIYR